VSGLGEEITERRRRTSQTASESRKDRNAKRRGRSKPGGITLACGCRWLYYAGAWLHVTPCRSHVLHLEPAGDAEMRFLARDAL